MLSLLTGRGASASVGARVYVLHRPERTLLYQLVEAYYPAFLSQLPAEGTALPGYVEREFEDYLKCGRLEHGFLRVCCDSCHAEHLVAFSCKRRGFCPALGHGVWPKAPRYWRTRCCRNSPCDNGCSASRFRRDLHATTHLLLAQFQVVDNGL